MAYVSDIIKRGADAAKGTLDALQDGTLYYATDTQVLYRWDGTGLAWEAVAGTSLSGTFIKADGSVDFTADQSMDGNQLTSVGDPANATDAANRGYVDSAIATAIGALGGGVGDTYLISGGQVEWVSGYSFRVLAATYKINGTMYSSAEVVLTCDAPDASDDRIDVIALDTSPAAVLIKGTVATPPNEPVVDPATQLRLSAIFLANGTTSPADSVEDLVYSENAGTPTEWAPTCSAGTIVSNSTTNPLDGTYCVRAATAAAGAYVKFVRAAPVALSAYDTLSIPMRIAAMASGRGVYVTLYLAGVRVGNQLTIANTYYGLNTANTTDYQRLLIDPQAFGLAAGATFDEIRLTGFGGQTSWAVDVVRFLNSGGTVVYTGGVTVAQGDARWLQRANNLSDVVSAATAFGNIKQAATTSATGVVELATDGEDAADKVVQGNDSRLDAFTGDAGAGGAKGLVPGPATGDAAAGKYLAAGGGWSVPAGAGDVTGPAGATGDNVAVFSGATGKVIKDGGTLGSAAFEDTSAFDAAGAAAARAPADAAYLVAQANLGLSSAVDLGSLTTGYLKATVAAGVATISTEAGPAPAAHAASHGSGEADAVTLAMSQISDAGDSATKDVGTAAGTVAAGDHTHTQAGSVTLTFGNGTDAITTGEPAQEIEFPFACTLTGWDLIADASGDLELYIWSCTYAEHDGGATHPAAGDSITASTPPALTADQKQTDADVSDWTEAVAAGDILRIGVGGTPATCKRATFVLKFTK